MGGAGGSFSRSPTKSRRGGAGGGGGGLVDGALDSAWLSDQRFSSAAVYAEIRLREVLEQTSHESSPCRSRAALACSMLYKLCEDPEGATGSSREGS